jgi:ATP-dependent DNA helicase RecQ
VVLASKQAKISSSQSAQKPKKPEKLSKPKKDVSDGPLTHEQELIVNILRDWRKDYADTRDIPAFLVFSNKTLHDLAVKVPCSTDELNAVYGLGPQKIDLFGKEILQKIQEATR